MTNSSEIEFPVEWTYRILCENSDKVAADVKAMLGSMGIEKLTKGNASSSGKYITLKTSKVVNSIEELNDLPKKVAALDGVRHVL